jgi:hypothetical protein
MKRTIHQETALPSFYFQANEHLAQPVSLFANQIWLLQEQREVSPFD